MKLIFANPGAIPPFLYATWIKVDPWAQTLIHQGTMFIGEPGVALGSLIEIKLSIGKWARDPIVSGGTLTNRTDGSIFVQVGDHANLTEFAVDLSGIPGPQRVGTAIQMHVFADRERVRTITLGYIGGVDTAVVPFFNPPTNPRQQTILVLNNHENDNWVRLLSINAEGEVVAGSAYLFAAGEQRIVEADAVYADIGAEPVAGNKLRLIVCSSAPLTVISKVRDSDSGLMCDNLTFQI